jgi:hypothetical protein
MLTPTDERICRRCSKPLVVTATKSKLWEGMHWACFLVESELIIVVVIGVTAAFLIALGIALKYTIEVPN